MRVKNYLITIIGIIICAISFNVFFLPYKIIPGGILGVSIILNKLFSINEVISLSMLSLMFLLIGCIFLKKDEIKKAILGTILLPIFVFLFNFLFNKIDLSIDNNLLTAIVGGVTFGFGLGIIYRNDHYIGGVDLLNRILDIRVNINNSVITFFTDVLVIVIGGFVFGFEIFVYSLVSIFICRLMIDKVRVGIGDNKSFYIITSKAKEIKAMILNDLGHGATIMKGKGAYTDDDKYIIFVVIPKKDYYKLKDGIKKIDPKAFFVVSSSYEVGGGK